MIKLVCKYARGKYNITPNDYDFSFDYTEIPSNINMEDAANLSARLQNLMPLTKILHLNLDTKPASDLEMITIHSNAKITFNGNQTVELKFL